MKHNREFEIAWQGMKLGVHHFDYDIDDAFLQAHGETEEEGVKDIRAKVAVTFDKKSSFFMLHFDIGGTAIVPCDRCGEDFQLNLWDEFDLVIKLIGEEEETVDEDADVVFIPRSETVIDISKWVYEFVMLSLPLQRIHPDLANGTPGCNPQVLALLNQLSVPKDQPKNDIWKGLEAFKNKTNNKRKPK